MNFITLLLTISLMVASVRSNENPLEANQNGDIKKVTATAEESAKELKSKDGDSLESLPSNQNTQTHYNSVYLDQRAGPVEVGVGPYGNQYSQQQSLTHQRSAINQDPITVYRPVDVTNTRYDVNAPVSQQQAYETPEQQVYDQKSYIRQPQSEGVAEDDYSKRQPESDASYEQQRDKPSTYSSPIISSPGISSTYSSPDVKIVSHTRTIMPIVYKKPNEQAGNTPTDTEQEYEKAVQGNPGGSYAREQQSNYNSDSIYNSAGYIPQSQSKDQYSGGYQRPIQQEEQQEVKQSYGNGAQEGSRTGYSPVQAHVQVIEEKNEYGGQQKEGYSQMSYGSRTQPRPQYKNYRPSGYTPSLIASPNAFSPPSPPLSSLVPPVYDGLKQDEQQQRPNGYSVGVEQSYAPQSGVQSYANDGQNGVQSYANNGQSGVQSYANDGQSGVQSYANNGQSGVQSYANNGQSGVQSYANNGQSVNYDAEKEKNSDSYNDRDNYSAEGYDQGSNGQKYSREKNNFVSDEDNSYSGSNENDKTYNRGAISERKPIIGENYRPGNYRNQFNAIEPKYNSERGPAYQRGSQLLKQQEFEYGFIPLNEENLKQMGGYGPEGYGQNRGPRNYGNRGKQEEDYVEEGPRYGAGNGAYGSGNSGDLRRPHFGNGGETVGQMYGRGNGGDGPRGEVSYGGDGYRGPAGGDGYRGPAGGHGKRLQGISGYRKPAFERPSYDKSVEDNDGYLKNYGNMANDEEDKDLDNEDTDYVGAAYKGHDGGLPPGASYNPRDVGLDESVIAQLNLDTMRRPIAPSMVAPPYGGGHGAHVSPSLDIPYSGSGPFPSFNGIGGHSPPVRPIRPRVPYSATGQGFRSQYGYRAAASEPVGTQIAPNSNNPVLSNLLNLNPIKGFRSLMSYLTGGING